MSPVSHEAKKQLQKLAVALLAAGIIVGGVYLFVALPSKPNSAPLGKSVEESHSATDEAQQTLPPDADTVPPTLTEEQQAEIDRLHALDAMKQELADPRNLPNANIDEDEPAVPPQSGTGDETGNE